MTGRFLHVPGLGWHVWSGMHWRFDELGEVMEFAKDVALDYASNAASDAERKWGYQSLSGGKLTTALALASTVPTVVASVSVMDTAAYELCTPAGVIDLRTALLRPANPLADRHTKVTAVTPDPDLPMPKFVAFMKWALQREDVIDYVQRLFGMALVGELLWHVFPIFQGKGRNGKSLLLELVSAVAGDYFGELGKDFLVEKSMSSHPTELAMVRGLRGAIASEVPAGARFDEQIVKKLTGDRSITARLIGKDNVTFPNVTSTFLLANHFPTVATGGSSWWSRVRVVKFEQSIAGRENPNLFREILDEEGPAILAWMLAGARDALERGERVPGKVKADTKRYQDEEDRVLTFTQQMLTSLPDAAVARDTVYEAYQGWCIRKGMRPMSSVRFHRDFELLNDSWVVEGNDAIYRGVVLMKSMTQQMPPGTYMPPSAAQDEEFIAGMLGGQS